MIKPFDRPRAGLYGWLVCTLAALFYCYEFLLRIQPGVMVPELMQNFSISAEGLGFLVALYYWAYTPLQIVVGSVTDYYGPRRVLIVAIGLCVIGSLMFGMTHSVYVGGVGRFLTGFGSAFAFIGVLKLASMWLPHNRFALFVGITTSLGMLGAMVGEIDMAWAVERFGWHHVVVAGALMGVVLIPLFMFFISERSEAGLEGSALNLHQTFSGLGTVLRNRQILLTGAIGCLLYLSLSVFAELWGVSFVRVATHLSPVQAAGMNSMVFFGWLVGSPFHGWLTDYLQSRRPQLMISSVLAGIAITLILFWPGMNTSLLYVLLFLFGFFSSAEVLCFAIARDVTRIRLVATAMAVVNCLVMLGGMIFQPFVGFLLDMFSYTGYGNEYSLIAYRIALLIIPVGIFSAAVLSYILKETYRDEDAIFEESR